MSAHLKPSFGSQKGPIFFSKSTAFRGKAISSIFSPASTFARKSIANVHISSIKGRPWELFQTSSLDEPSSQEKLEVISDPLWKKVCMDISHSVGFCAIPRIWGSKLGDLSVQDTIVDIYCLTEKTAQFLRKYDFIVLASLQQYFPTLQKIRVISDSERKIFTV